MRRVQSFLLISVAIFGMLMLPGFSTVPSPKTPELASYNPSPANRFHSPLSAMGLVGTTGARPESQGQNLTTVKTTSNPFVPQTVKQNALRFINDNSSFPQSETSIAVDPSNTAHVVGGFNDARYFFCPPLPDECAGPQAESLSGFTTSIDGGKTVAKSSDLPNLKINFTQLVPWGDPSVAAGTDGTFFYASLAFNPFSTVFGNGIMIAKSNSNLFDPTVSCNTTNINTYTNPCWTARLVFGAVGFPIFNLEDKDRIAVDRNPMSPFFGSVYVSWDHFTSGGTSLGYLARCDSNLATCVMLSGGSQPVVTGTDLFVSWTTVIVSADDNVHVAWCNFGTFVTLGPVTCRMVSSGSGGTSFGLPSDIVSYMGQGTMLPGATVVIGWATEQFRVGPGLISVAADTSGQSSNLYFTTQVCASGHYYLFPSFLVPVSPDNPGLCGRSVVLFSRSLDGGATWQVPVGISRPAVNDQPYVTVDSNSGLVDVVYYSTQYDPFDHRVDVVAATSKDGGSTFHQFRVTSVSNEPDSDPAMYNYLAPGGAGGSLNVPQYGDYFEAISIHGTVWVLFTANYAVVRGTFQTDPFLAVMTLNG